MQSMNEQTTSPPLTPPASLPRSVLSRYTQKKILNPRSVLQTYTNLLQNQVCQCVFLSVMML